MTYDNWHYHCYYYYQYELSQLSCHTRLSTVLMSYAWIGNSISRERNGRCTGIILIRIGQHIIYRNIIIMNGCYTVIHLPSHRTNMIPSYRTINRITQLIVYDQNNSVLIVFVGTDGHLHDNIHIIISIPIPNPLLSFHCTYQHHHI